MIRVLTAGFYNTIQDLGRTGYRSIGVPSSGAMDFYSAKLANSILNNDKHAALLEITFGSCRLRFDNDCLICITGAHFSAQVNGCNIALNKAYNLSTGDVLSFGKQIYGVRSYLAIKGGFQSEQVLGSRSWYPRITSAKGLTKEMVLPYDLNQGSIPDRTSSVKVNADHFDTKVIPCTKGPEFDLLSESEQAQLLSLMYTIAQANNRMGYKLEEILEHTLPSMLTSAVLPGTVQLTPSGRLIVLMRDSQVTGGYPRVLQLTEQGINRLAQKTTGDRIQFQCLEFNTNSNSVF